MQSLRKQRKRKTFQAKERECLPGETLCKAGTFVSHVKVLRESGTPRKRIYEVVVIEAGESLNRRFYPDETLQTAVPLFDGKSVHAFRFSDNELNHLPEVLRDHAPIGGPLGNKVGTLKKPYWCPDKRAVIAELHVPVNDSTRWFLDMATSSLDLQEPQFGFSIDGQGEAFPKRVRGKVVEWVDSLTDIFSLDAVSNPAAGGRLLAQAFVENVVGDPRSRLLQYEMRSRNRRLNRRSRPKQRRLRSTGVLNEGVNMNFRTSRPLDGTKLVRKVLRTLSNEKSPRAKSVKRSLRIAESVSGSGQMAEVNVDRLRRQLESIPKPSRKVRSAISQLRSARANASPKSGFREQDEIAGEELAINSDEFSAEGAVDIPVNEPVDLVEELMELLEEEIEEAALEVFSTLKKAKEFSEVGGTVELNVKDLLETLKEIEEPSRQVRKSIKLLKDELKRIEGEAEFDGELGADLDFDLGSDLPSAGAGAGLPPQAPPIAESFRHGFQSRRRREKHRHLGVPSTARKDRGRLESEVSYLRKNLRIKDHEAQLRTALQEAEGNGLPKSVSEELYQELRNESQISQGAVRRKINSRIRQANALVESIKPDFRDLNERPVARRGKSAIEKVIFEAR